MACWCDNTPTVAWASNFFQQMQYKQQGYLEFWHLHDCMLGIPTHHIIYWGWKEWNGRLCISFVSTISNFTEFSNWIPCSLFFATASILDQIPGAKKIIGCIFSKLLMPTLILGLWRQLRKHGSITGGTGSTFFPQVSIHTFKTWLQLNESWCCKILLNGHGKELLDMEKRTNWKHPDSPQHHHQENWTGWESQPQFTSPEQ